MKSKLNSSQDDDDEDDYDDESFCGRKSKIGECPEDPFLDDDEDEDELY